MDTRVNCEMFPEMAVACVCLAVEQSALQLPSEWVEHFLYDMSRVQSSLGQLKLIIGIPSYH